MKKYIYFFLCSSILYTTDSPHEAHKNLFQSIAINLDETFKHEKIIPENDGISILGCAIFELKAPRKYSIQDKTFDTNHNVKFLIKLLQNDFKSLQKCCNFDADHDDFFDGIDSIDLQETALLIDHTNNRVNLNYLESTGKGVCIETNNFINIIQAWKACLDQNCPYLLLIQSLHNEYEIQPFYTKNSVDAYLETHPIP